MLNSCTAAKQRAEQKGIPADKIQNETLVISLEH